MKNNINDTAHQTEKPMALATWREREIRISVLLSIQGGAKVPSYTAGL